MNRLDYLEFTVLAALPSALPPRQFVGLPPELTGEGDQRRAMPHATVLVLIRDTDGAIYLHRFAPGGVGAGDTWHPDVAAAKEQAEFEYGDAVGDWRPLPNDITDLEAFVRSLSP